MAISAAHGRSTRRWRRIRADAIAGGTAPCIVCGHTGTDTGGHKEARSKRPELAEVRANVGAIHGDAGCPTCQRKCNNEMGNKSLAEMVELNTSRDWFVDGEPC